MPTIDRSCDWCKTPLKWDANFCPGCLKPIDSAKKLLQTREAERRLQFKLAFALFAALAVAFGIYWLFLSG